MESQDYVCLLHDDLVISLIDCLDEGHVFEASPDDRRQIGVFSASLLIFNRVIGTGIFATPGTILALAGSVGLSLFMWVIGTAIALAGTAVYLEWGTAIPRYVMGCW
jgi:amino acid permease